MLDLACGNGALSRLIADRGATVTAVDASAGMLRHAEPSEHVDYRHGDATDTDWWDGDPYDGVVCNMALMDLPDLDAGLQTIAAVLKPAGWALITLLHPCFPGRAETGTFPSWPPDRGYGWEGWWNTGSYGVRGHAGAHHRRLSTYLNAVLGSGLEFVEFAEPPDDIPRVLVLRCRRAPGAG